MKSRVGLVSVLVVGLIAACSDSGTSSSGGTPADGGAGTPGVDSSTAVDSGPATDSAPGTDSGPQPTCATAGCSADATCSEASGAPVCTCKAGFSGDGKTCTDINDCAPNPCLNGGTCTDGVSSYTCACAAGYSGTTCQTNIDDCAPNPCLNGGVCTDGVNSFTCACAAGYSGATCQTNIDDCAPNPCLHSGVCTDGVNSFTCACAGGYSGATCAVPPTSCSAIKAANAGAADGVYEIDPDGAGGVAAFSVYCDMTTDGGGWTKILQYHAVAYLPTSAAAGDVTTAATPAFAKLSDASINLLGAALGAGRVYRIKGPISPLGQKLFIFSAAKFDDTAVGLGLMSNNLGVCENASFAACAKSAVAATYIDSFAWGLVGNDAERYFADYAGGSGVNCYNPSAAGVRCFNAGVSTGHQFIPDVSIWMK